MKILHLATDDKFLDHAFPVFEKVYPGANDVFVFAAKTPLKYVKLKPDRIEEIKPSSVFYKKPKLSSCIYSKYDLVVFHCLASQTCQEIINIPEETPIVWLGWGADYYPDLLTGSSLYLHRTRELMAGYTRGALRRELAGLVKRLVKVSRVRTKKIRAIERVAVFSPVLPNEYDMVRRSRHWKRFPKYGLWNYGTMEDNLIKGFEGESVTGKAILVGNSATYTGNHAEAFDLLHQLQVGDRKVVAPLSYGDVELAKKLTAMGQDYFSNNFEPLMDFMAIQDYVAIIKKCGYVIMNHIRQQAVGNIVIMLYLGARVFVRQENPVYEFFKRLGVVISTVQQLAEDPELLNTPLTDVERSDNKAIVSIYWSRESAYERTRTLVDAAFEAKGVERPALLCDAHQ